MVTKLNRRVALFLFIGVLASAACGDDGGGAVAGGTTTTATPSSIDAADDGEGEDDHDGGELPDPCELIEASEVEALIGPATQAADSGVAMDMVRFTECVWEAEDRSLVGVAITNGPNRYELHSSGFLVGEPVDGLADGAFMAVGVSLETKGASGGRTVSMLVGERTVVVALRLEGATPPESVLPLAESVLARLG